MLRASIRISHARRRGTIRIARAVARGGGDLLADIPDQVCNCMQAASDLLRVERLVELTQTLVRIPSETGREHAIGDWLAQFLHALGLIVQRIPVEDAGDTIVGTLAATSSSDGPTMMLNFHLDTFDAFEGWETDPFDPRLSADGSRIVGLGAHDMKAGAACVLGAVEAIVHSSAALGGTLLVVGTTDEEYWSRGAHALVASGLIDRCSYNIVPEPVRAGVHPPLRCRPGHTPTLTVAVALI